MTDVARALYSFFSGFGLPAYVEDSVPEDTDANGEKKPVKPPYITYQLIAPDWRESGLLSAHVWYRSDSLEGVLAKADEIAAAIGEGKSIKTINGAVYLSKGTPFRQLRTFEGDPTLKAVYLNIIINAIT